MSGISNRFVSFANFYNQLKFPVVVESSFVKWVPGLYFVAKANCISLNLVTTDDFGQENLTKVFFDKKIIKKLKVTLELYF